MDFCKFLVTLEVRLELLWQILGPLDLAIHLGKASLLRSFWRRANPESDQEEVDERSGNLLYWRGAAQKRALRSFFVSFENLHTGPKARFLYFVFAVSFLETLFLTFSTFPRS